MQTQQTIADLLQMRKSMMGYEIEQLVKLSLDSLDNEEASIAEELMERYFGCNVADNCKPLKFVYYRIVKVNDAYTLRRNLYMSPRATGYFSKEDETTDELRDVIRNKHSVKGEDLKRLVEDGIAREYQFPTREHSQEESTRMSYDNLSKQFAQYIYDYFVNCEKAIKDDIWYVVSCKEYGTATIYRDLNKSPRANNK